MRNLLLASGAMFALVLAHPGFAQTASPSNSQPRAIGQQNPAPADMSAPTNPTVPAEIQAPILPDQTQTLPGEPAAPDGQRGGLLQPDQGLMPLREAQNQVPPDQVQSLPGQPAAPHGQAANQEGQSQPTDSGTPMEPAAPPGMPGVIAPDQVQTPPGHPAAPHGQGSDDEGQSRQHGDAQPALMSFQVAQNDAAPGQAAPSAGTAAATTEGYNAAGHEAMSRSASNIDASDTRNTIAPSLPPPPAGANASPADLLHVARDALGRNATGEAQEALERAETRLLDRSTAPSNADTPDSHDAVQLIDQARQALGHHDLAQAGQAINSALQRPAVMQHQSASTM